jgi:membrane-bound lytic murein transglycosylase D
MQYRYFFVVPFLFLSTMAIAQKQQDFAMKPQMRTIKTDTIVMPKAVKAIPEPKALAAASAQAQKSAYKPVPLAGESSYYGSMNDYVTDFVRKYLTVNNRTLSVVMDRGDSRFSLIDNVLQQHDIPKELKYLAVIESALNNNAVSKVGAVGPWQFMASTAKLMGLTVNGRRDDRRDLYKSTNAAAKYLAYLYSQLNDWLLVVAAYNSGPTPVQRAITKTGSTNFWDIKKHLPKETQGHVLAFIATATIFENLSKFIGMGSLPTDFNFSKDPRAVAVAEKKPVKPQFTDEELKSMAIVRISQPISMDLLCQELSIDKKTFDKWNDDYDLFEYNTYPTEYYSLRIPKEKLDKFIEKKEYLGKRSKQIYAQLNM